MPSIINATTSTGLVSSADNSGSLQLATNNGTTAITIDSSQNVGIGSTSPVSLLEVKDASPILTINQTDTSTTCRLAFYGYNRNYETTAINTTEGGTAGAGNLTFWTNSGGSGNSTERMRITSAGNLGVGTTSPDSKIRADDTANQTIIAGVNSNASFTAAGIFLQMSRNTTNNTFFAIDYYNAGAGAYKFRVADSGNVTNTNGSYGTISDVKLKENIVDATPKLDKVNQLQVRNYNFIGDDLKQIGFVAQEFEQVFPSMVEESADKDKDGNNLGTTTKTIKTTVLIPILVKAIQELKAELDATKAEVQALKGTL